MLAWASGEEVIIRCEHVYVSYGREPVLHDVCLEIHRGDFLPFVGPNGAGKTTLLRAILGLIRPRSGRVSTPFSLSPAGYVPQQKNIDPLYPVSLAQIVAMGFYPSLGWWRRPSREQRNAQREVLERFGLADHAHKTYAELSGGMKQKALIARAFLSGAEVFVMDEPVSDLDEGSEKEVLAHMLRLSREEGKTVLIALHGLSRLPGLPDTLCSVDRGRVHLSSSGEAGYQKQGIPSETGGTP